MSTIYEAAVEFQKLMGYEYKFVFGYKGKTVDFHLRFFDDKFFHLCGLHKLKDIEILNEDTNTSNVFMKILNGEITHQKLQSSKFFYSEDVDDRINRVAELSTILNETMKQKLERDVYKYNNNINPFSNIKASFMIKALSKDQRTVYFIIDKNKNDPNYFFGLSIFSRDLLDKTQKDFAAGHTFNTLLYLSKTPLTENKELDKNNEEVLFKLDSYTVPSDGNITIVKFESPDYNKGDIAAIDIRHLSIYGQADSPFFGKIKQFFTDKIPQFFDNISLKMQLSELEKQLSKREDQLFTALEENKENKLQLAEKDELLSEKDKQLADSAKEIASLKEENSALSEELKELEKQKQPVLTAAKSKGSFGDNLVGFADRVRTGEAAKSQQQGNPDFNPKNDNPKH